MFTDAGYPITEANMVLQLQTAVGATGMVNEEYNAWKKKPAADKTWANAKKHFRDALANVEGIQKLTTASGGMYANNIHIKTIEDKVCNEITVQLGESFDNLAMAATAKADTIDRLSKTIADLTATNAQLAADLKHMKTQWEQAMKLVKQQRASSPTDGKNNQQQNDGKKCWPAWCDPDAYCHTCGYKLRKGHNSKTCKFASNPGHKKEATRANTMGGSQLNAGFGNPTNGE